MTITIKEEPQINARHLRGRAKLAEYEWSDCRC